MTSGGYLGGKDHARQLGEQIKQLGGRFSGSAEMRLGNQKQPPADNTEVIGVIEAVIGAEERVCQQHQSIIKGIKKR